MDCERIEAGRGAGWVGWGWRGVRLTCELQRDANDGNRGAVAVWRHDADTDPEDGELVAGGLVAGFEVAGFEGAAAVMILVDVAYRLGWPSEVIDTAAGNTGGGVA